MSTLILIILCISVVIGVIVLIFSNQGDPKERAKEAGMAADMGALYSAGCIIQTIMSVIPLLIGLFFISLLLKSCH